MSGMPIRKTGIPRPGLGQYTRPSSGNPGPSVRLDSRMPQVRPATQPTFGLRVPPTVSTRSGSSQAIGVPPKPSSTGTKEVQSTAKITVTKPTGQRKTSAKTEKAVVSKASGPPSKTKIGEVIGPKRSVAAVPIPPPSVLRRQVALQVKGTAAKASMGSKVTAVAVKKSKAAPLEKIMTPSGPQQIIQKTITEKRVERSKRGEIVFRNIKTIEVDPSTGDIIQVEEEVQKLNPDFPAPKGPVKEIVTIVSENDITASYETRRENRVQETIKLDPDMGMDLRQVSQLVDEEKEDVHNILQYLPPDLDNQSPEMYPLKKRLQALRLTSENISSLEKSVINPPPSADEPLAEASPELMAIVMNTAEKDAMPNAPPVQIFNSLFRAEPRDYPLLVVSSATPGPLGDVVVPITVPEVVHEDMLSQEMEEVSVIVQVGTVQPPTNGFSKSQPSRPKKRGRRKRQYTPLTEEDPPWDTDDLNVVMEALGARVNRSVHPTNVLETTQGGRLKSEIAKGIEYILDAEPLQYYSRVQLRGSQPPSWFPGYMVALTDMSNSVAIAKSPSQVLFSAWRSVQPDVFPDDSIVYN